VGNDKIDYLSAYSTTNIFNGVLGAGDGEQVVSGVTDDRLGNPDLIWEEITQANIGIEFGMFEQRLTAEIDYFYRETDGALVSIRLPDFLGNGTNAVVFNAADFLNEGLEWNVNWNDQVGNIRYNVGLNGNTLRNETLRIDAPSGSAALIGIAQNQEVSRTFVGTPIGAFSGYQVEGIFQNQDQIDETPSLFGTQPGDLIFRDVNEDGVINDLDRTQIGSPIPDIIYGINLGIGYKNFDLSLLFQGQSGNEIFNIKETNRFVTRLNYEQRYINYWRGEGTSNTEPRPTAGGNNFLPSSRFIQDGSFFRLRTITLSYLFPRSILEKAKLSSGRLFVRGNNVFTITDYTGFSPEVGAATGTGGSDGGAQLTSGVSTGTYPVFSTYSVGIDLTF
ncbi:MAG: hypothetical protein AAF789_09640, partial [Bacteroidota bacterium]